MEAEHRYQSSAGKRVQAGLALLGIGLALWIVFRLPVYSSDLELTLRLPSEVPAGWQFHTAATITNHGSVDLEISALSCNYEESFHVESSFMRMLPNTYCSATFPVRYVLAPGKSKSFDLDLEVLPMAPNDLHTFQVAFTSSNRSNANARSAPVTLSILPKTLSLESLENLSRSRDRVIRRHSIKELEALGEPAVSVLGRILNSEHESLAGPLSGMEQVSEEPAFACEALKKIGGKQAEQLLESYAERRNPLNVSELTCVPRRTNRGAGRH
jgi:hypothetical protein